MSKNIIKLTVGPFATNCWIYPIDDTSVAIIDPGEEADAIISALKKSKLTPKYILLTHGHFDHIEAVAKLSETFSGLCQIAIHRLDSEYLGEGSRDVHKRSLEAAMGDTSLLDHYWKNMLPGADILLEEGSEIGPFTVIHLPGHTQGSVAFWDKEEGVLFTGDTLFNRGYGRTDLPGGSEEQIFGSLRRLFKMDPNVAVYPGHGETTSIGKELR